MGEGITGSEDGGSGELVEAAVERRRASGAVAAEARPSGERKQRLRGTFRAGAKAWRRSSDAMGGWRRAEREGGGAPPRRLPCRNSSERMEGEMA